MRTLSEFAAWGVITGPTSARAFGRREMHDDMSRMRLVEKPPAALTPNPSPIRWERGTTEQGHATPSPGAADRPVSESPPRPAWIEIDLRQLKRNFQILNQDKPEGLQVLSVVKDEAYGHGAWAVAKTALECGACFL